MDRARARPVRVTRRDDELAVDVRRVVAYVAECPCGWRGPSRRLIGVARCDADVHSAAHRHQAAGYTIAGGAHRTGGSSADAGSASVVVEHP